MFRVHLSRPVKRRFENESVLKGGVISQQGSIADLLCHILKSKGYRPAMLQNGVKMSISSKTESGLDCLTV